MKKFCKGCQRWLSVAEFSKSKATKDGLQSKCKSCAKAAYDEWRAKNPERAKEHSRNQIALLKERNPNYFKEWHSKNYATPEGRGKALAKNQKRRARLAGASGDFTAEEFAELCLMYDGICLACGADDVRLTIDHVVPLSLGGSNSIDNIQPLCGPCNSRKGNRSCQDFRPQNLAL